MTNYIDCAIEVAKQAGQYQLERLNSDLSIEYKGDINIVTEVDKACEALIINTIQKKYPTHDVLAEEGGGERKNSDYKWIIDPLDGTTNFSHGYPLFCVSIALEFKGEIILGVVFEPNHNELFTSEKNSGSFLNGKKIKVSRSEEIGKSLLCTGFAYNIREVKDNNLNHFKNMLMKARAVRRDGVAAVDLCYVACGRYDGFWERNLFPWDVAAGMLIVNEAGGTTTDFKGNQFSVYEKEILADNSRIHPEMLKILNLQ